MCVYRLYCHVSHHGLGLGLGLTPPPFRSVQLPEAYVTSGSSSASMTAVESDDVLELAGHLGGAVFAAFADFLEQAVKVSDAGCGCEHAINSPPA